jgi:hypothetical protein
MAQFWLSENGSTEILNLDNSVIELEIGGVKRAFNIEEFGGSNGGYFKGFGNITSRKIKVTRIDKAAQGDATAFNSDRNDFMKWFTKEAWQTTYFNILDGEGVNTYQAEVKCGVIPEDKYKFYRITDGRAFTLLLKDGLFTSTSESSGSLAITGSTQQTTTITVGGNIGVWPTFKFTPTGLESSFQVSVADGWKFTLSGTFAAGVQLSYNMQNGELLIDNATVNVGAYLTGGSPFPLKVGDNTVYVLCSGAGLFEYNYYNRVV